MSDSSRQQIEEFERIVNERQDWLFRFAYMRIGRREDAEDVVQEVLMALFGKMMKDKEISNVDAYIIRSVNNACIDWHRRKRHKFVPIGEIEDQPECDADRQMHEEFLRIIRLLADLPEEQAETVRLKCYDGLTFNQIAEIKNIPEPTVKSRYRYAIINIQKRLRKDYGYGK